MTPAAQVAAAIEILEKLADNRRPAGDILKEWGFAPLRRVQGPRRDLQPRLRRAEKARLIRLYYGRRQRPRRDDRRAARGARPERRHDQRLSRAKATPLPAHPAGARALEKATLDGAPAHVRGDYPEWLEQRLEAALGEAARKRRGAGRARSDRFAGEILKASPEQALEKLAHLNPRRRRSRRSACAYSPAPTDAARRWRRRRPS